MQKEYDKWFYHDETLDHLPAATLPQGKAPSEMAEVICFGRSDGCAEYDVAAHR